MDVQLKKQKKDIRPYRYDFNEEAYVSNINACLLYESEIMTSDANVLVQKFDTGLVIQYWYFLDGYCECLINKPYRPLQIIEEGKKKTYLRIEETPVCFKLPEPFGRVNRFVVDGEAKPGYEEITNISK